MHWESRGIQNVSLVLHARNLLEQVRFMSKKVNPIALKVMLIMPNDRFRYISLNISYHRIS
jgi:hypothetical protein